MHDIIKDQVIAAARDGIAPRALWNRLRMMHHAAGEEFRLTVEHCIDLLRVAKPGVFRCGERKMQDPDRECHCGAHA
jgi:hypothetical protein